MFSDNNKFTIMVGYEDIQYKNCGDSGRYVNVPAAWVVNFLHILLKSPPFVAHVYMYARHKDWIEML